MKIILSARSVFPFHGYGGVQTHIYNLAKHLVKAGAIVEIVTTSKGNHKNIEQTTYHGIKYTFLPQSYGRLYEKNILLKKNAVANLDSKPRPFTLFLRNTAKSIVDKLKFLQRWANLVLGYRDLYQYLRFSYQVSRFLSNEKFDILQAVGFISLFYLMRRNRKPVIVQTFGLSSFKENSWDDKLKMLPNKLLLGWCLRHADSISAMGRSQAEEIACMWRKALRKIFYIPNGVDVAEIQKTFANRKVLRKDLKIAEDDLVLVTVNRLEPHKRVHVIIHALSKVKEYIGNAYLIIIGDGSERGRLEQIAKTLNITKNALFVGNVSVDLLYSYLISSDIYINASIEKNIILSVIEGMACGLPVISSGIRLEENVIIDGVNGYNVPVDDSTAIANAALAIQRSGKMKQMGKKSIEISTRYDWNRIAQSTLDKYAEILASAKS